MDNIPQTFKVEWLNTTLKFIKDDTLLLKEYPQMPSSHVEYLHNLIWHRKNSVGLGIKSLYSPIWEAMRIFSVKYQFKITVQKSEDGKHGHLIMEKIPKSSNESTKDNGKIDGVEDENPIQQKPPENNKKKQLKTEKVKKMPKMTKGFKSFLENQKILETLSPSFVKESLKIILYFIFDESSASKIFSDLAPTESKFLQKILSFSKRKNDFEAQLSPLCYEMLTDLSNYIGGTDINFRLHISTRVDDKTNKREVIFKKQPIFPSKKQAKKMNWELMVKNIAKKKNVARNVNNAEKIEHTTDNKDLSEFQSDLREKGMFIKNIKDSNINKSTTSDQNVALVKGNAKMGSEDIQNTKTKNITVTITNMKPLCKIVPKKAITFAKEGTMDTDDNEIKRESNNQMNSKIMQDMAVPVTNVKAVRMMQLMGWKGGALGLHGTGITEPIIPTANYNCSGLGHVPKEQETKKKKAITPEFTSTILDMINIGLEMTTFVSQDKFTDNELKFWEKVIDSMNKRVKINKSVRNSRQIQQKMKENKDIFFTLDFLENNMMMVTKHERKKGTEKIIEENPNLLVLSTKTKFIMLIMTTLIELIESYENEKLLNFEHQLKGKFIKRMLKIIEMINKRDLKQKMKKGIKDLVTLLIEKMEGNLLLSAEVGENYRSITLIKNIKQQESVENHKTLIVKNESSPFDNITVVMETRKKHKILNELYKKEFDYEDEYKENDWYNKIEDSLIDNKELSYVKDINDNQVMKRRPD